MQPAQRTALTKALSGHVTAIAADLRRQMLVPGTVRDRAKQLHTDEQVADDFDDWTELLSRRAAVLWVLKTVYLRVLEDRGLLRPGRLLDPEAQQLFERLAPNLGETAFLSWVFRDLASTHGGLPELFALQPAEICVPADSLSRALIVFWRSKDADTGFQWDFGTEAFAGELMGDLYQELDPIVKLRYALCQTPDFVRDFILGLTLTPAIAEFGADAVRVIDPACGSGHFLLDGLRRLVAETAQQHGDWSRRQVVDHALDRVVGLDINDYACALARARLVMTAAELAGVASLEDAARFHPHVYWADGLEQIERDEDHGPVQLDFLNRSESAPPRAVLTRPHIRRVLKPVLAQKFHVVVGNPPYIVEQDPRRKAYHRERVVGGARYKTAYREYSLVGPFLERAFQLATSGAYVGFIVGNAFAKAHFGKPLVEKVLAKVELSLVVDTQYAFLPHHGTPTCLVFFRNTRPTSTEVPVVSGKRSVPGIPPDPATAPVWSSLMRAFSEEEYEDENAAKTSMPRQLLAKHPWPIGSGAMPLHLELEGRATATLNDLSKDLGATVLTRADEVFVADPGLLRRRFPGGELRPFVTGRRVRDWFAGSDCDVIYPYLESDPQRIASARIENWLWPFKMRLWLRREPNGNHREIGLAWWEWSRFIRRRYSRSRRIVMSNVATHTHFALVTEPLLLGAHAPSISLPDEIDDETAYALLALLNSSVACFWLKKVSKPKGATAANRNHPDAERSAFEFTTTALARMPLVLEGSSVTTLARLAKSLDSLARERAALFGQSWWEGALESANTLKERLSARWRQSDSLRQRMIFLQEEIDWVVYSMFGLTKVAHRAPEVGSQRLPRGQRAFELLRGRRSFVRERGQSVPFTDAEVDTGAQELPQEYIAITTARVAEIETNDALAEIEQYLYKRLWRDTEENLRESVYRERYDRAQLEKMLADRAEELVSAHKKPMTLRSLCARLQDEGAILTVAEVLARTPAFDLESIVRPIVKANAVPSSHLQLFTESGLIRYQAWEASWQAQRSNDAGEAIDVPTPPEFSQGSRGKPRDFLRDQHWRLRGSLNVARERFVEFAEATKNERLVNDEEVLYGWSGWSVVERIRAILAIDEECEEHGSPLQDRIALLYSAWRLLPAATREDAIVAERLRVEIQSIVGADGPSPVLLDEWKQRFALGGRGRKQSIVAANEHDDDSDEEVEE